jgi:hypothetical protein
MLCLLAHGGRLTAKCTGPLAGIEIPHLPRETGCTLECQDAANGRFIFHIKRGKAWEQHFFARGPPMRRDPGAVSLLWLYHGKAMPGGRPGDGWPKFLNAGFRAACAARPRSGRVCTHADKCEHERENIPCCGAE